MLVLVVFVRALRQRSWKNFTTQETVCGKNLTYFLFLLQGVRFLEVANVPAVEVVPLGHALQKSARSMYELAGHLQP